MAQNKVQRRAVKAETTAVEIIPLRYLTIPNAAKYLATTVWDIRQLIAARKIPFSKLGKRFVLDVRDLDQYFESQKVKAAWSLNRREVSTSGK